MILKYIQDRNYCSSLNRIVIVYLILNILIFFRLIEKKMSIVVIS